MKNSTAMSYAEIIVALSNKEVDKIFHYAIPESLKSKIALGMRAFVPFGKGNRLTEGYVTGFRSNPELPPEKIKPIHSLPDGFPLFDEDMLFLAEWMRNKYYTTLFSCLKTILPAGIHMKKNLGRKIKYAYLNDGSPDLEEAFIILEGTPQGQALRLLRENDGLPVMDVKEYLHISDSPLKTLEKKHLITIEEVEMRRDVFSTYEGETDTPPALTREQKEAVVFILRGCSAPGPVKPVLIHGVTGSGKTEIYLHCIEETLRQNKQAIMLVPEISLTPQTVGVFLRRFGSKIAVTHSRLSLGERYEQWKKALDGEISIMIGPRSAVFTPFHSLGMIIIDEEHENTYKSETTPKYSAVDVAIERCKRAGAMVILGSATPSVGSYNKAQSGEYELLTLKERVNKKLPEVQIVDMRRELAEGNRSVFSRPLLEAMEESLAKKQQVILFLNRRGFSTFVSCRSCGAVMTCDDCNVNFTYHQYRNDLICHYCGKTKPNPEKCPVCGSVYIRYFGVGTQKIEAEVGNLFPAENILRMDLDTTSRKNSHENILNRFKNKEASILIGTQMIAKGLDFPNVSVVGIMAADLSINNGDFRSGETSFQLLTQVSGRAGRADIDGRVFIQTYNTEHYSIRFAKESNYAGFYEHEISLRRQMNYPPFTHVFVVLFTSEGEKNIIVLLYKLLDIIKADDINNEFETLGPSPAYISKIKKQYRWKLIIKGQDEDKLREFVLKCTESLKKQESLEGVHVNLSLDPLMNI